MIQTYVYHIWWERALYEMMMASRGCKWIWFFFSSHSALLFHIKTCTTPWHCIFIRGLFSVSTLHNVRLVELTAIPPSSHNASSLTFVCSVGCLVTQSRPTLCEPMDCSPPGSSVHGILQAKTTGVCCHALLQGIFPTQGLNRGLPHCRWILYCLSHQG